MSKVCILYVYICSHFGSILIQVETPCDKLGMTKGQFRLRLETYDQYKELIPFQHWYNKNKKNPIFRHLLAAAYRNWKVLVVINNKVVKKKATSIGASSGPGSAVGAPPAGPQVQKEKCDLGLTNQLIN